MSFFFDVFCQYGFVLVSEQIQLESTSGKDKKTSLRKILPNPHFRANDTSRVNCAIVVCGDYPVAALGYFSEACAAGDTLRDVAKRFAEKWTEKYQPLDDELCDSAVHLVGFERIPDSNVLVPQMWYWTTRLPEDNQIKFYTKRELEQHVLSFSENNPHNNHMCRIFANISRLPVPSTLQEEHEMVMTYFEENGPHLTWNGDLTLWGSALHAAQALQPIFSIGWLSTLENLAEITNLCLEFLVKINTFLPNQTLSLAADGNPDILLLSADNIERYIPKGPGGAGEG